MITVPQSSQSSADSAGVTPVGTLTTPVETSHSSLPLPTNLEPDFYQKIQENPPVPTPFYNPLEEDSFHSRIELQGALNRNLGSESVKTVLDLVRDEDPDHEAYLLSESKRLNVPASFLKGLKEQYHYSNQDLMYALNLPVLSDYLLKDHAAAISKDDIVQLAKVVEKLEHQKRKRETDILESESEMSPSDRANARALRSFSNMENTYRYGSKERSLALWDAVPDDAPLGEIGNYVNLSGHSKDYALALTEMFPGKSWGEIKNEPGVIAKLTQTAVADLHGGLFGFTIADRGKQDSNALVQYFKDLGFYFKRGRESFEFSQSAGKMAADGVIPYEQAKLLELSMDEYQSGENAAQTPSGFWEGMIPGTAEMLYPLAKSAAVMVAGNKAAGAVSAAKLGLMAKRIQTVLQSTKQSPLYAAVLMQSVKTGSASGLTALGKHIGTHPGTTLSAVQWYTQGRADTYMGLRARGVDHETANALGTIAAVPYAGVEYLQMHWITKGTGLERALSQSVFGKLAGKAGAAVSGKILAENTISAMETAAKESVMKRVIGFTGRTLTSGVMESMEEAVQEGILVTAEEAAVAIDNVLNDHGIEHAPLWSREAQQGVLERVWLSFADSLGPMTLLGIPGAFSASSRKARLFEYLNEREIKLNEKKRSGVPLREIEKTELTFLQEQKGSVFAKAEAQSALQSGAEEYFDEERKISQADEFFQSMEAIRTELKASKTFQRSPDHIESLVDSIDAVLGETAAQTLFADPLDLQSAAGKIPQFFERAGITPEQLAEATEQNTPISVAYGKVLTLPDAEWQTLLPHLKSSENGLSFEQAKFRKAFETHRDSVEAVRKLYEDSESEAAFDPVRTELSRIESEIIQSHPNLVSSAIQAQMAVNAARYKVLQSQIGTEKTVELLKKVHFSTGEMKDAISDSSSENHPYRNTHFQSAIVPDHLITEGLNREMREEVQRILTPYRGKILTCKADGSTAKIGANGISKLTSEKSINKSMANGFSPNDHFTAAVNIVRLFENAIRRDTFADRNNDPNIKAIHRYSSPMTLNGETATAYITVKESHEKGGRIYSVELLEIKKPVDTYVDGNTANYNSTGYNNISPNDGKVNLKKKEKQNILHQPRGEDIRLAPNGKPSNLNAKQWAQVRTSEFKEWFGDWENDPENVSKAVDENGAFDTEDPDIHYQDLFMDQGTLNFFGNDETPDYSVLLSENILGNELAIQDELDFSGEGETRKESVVWRNDDVLSFGDGSGDDDGTPLTEAGRLGTTQSAPGIIDDFGEKIGGARKELWGKHGLTSAFLMSMTLQERELLVTRENVWPKPNYRKLAEGGMDLWRIGVMKETYDSLRKAPAYHSNSSPEERDEIRRTYIDAVTQLRDIIFNSETLEQVIYEWNQYVGFDGGFDDVHRTMRFQLGSAYSLFAYRDLKNNPNKQFFESIIKRFERNAGKLTVDPIRKRWFFGTQDGEFYANGKGQYFGKRNNGFKTLEEALAWARQKEEELNKERTPSGSRGSGVTNPEDRVGRDWRSGRNISGEDLIAAFGFRGGEFGNWVNQKERQQALNAAYDALMDLSAVLNLPLKALSLNGELGIAFGSRGIANASAHYEPSKIVINLTKLNGGGSLAHEWAHAMDDYFGRRHHQGRPAQWVTERNFGDMRSELKAAFSRVMDSIYKDEWGNLTEFYKAAARVKTNKKYWTSDIELFARAFAFYVSKRITDKMEKSPYLVRDSDSPLNIPAEAEGTRIAEAFDHLVATLQTRNNDSEKVELFQNLKSKKNRYQQFLESYEGNFIVKYLMDKGIRVRRPATKERQNVEAWKCLPTLCKGTVSEGTTLDMLHLELEKEGMINADSIYASDLYGFFADHNRNAKKAWQDLKLQDALADREAKEYDDFNCGKTSEILTSDFLIACAQKFPGETFSFTRMGEAFRAVSGDGEVEVKGAGTPSVFKSGQFIRIDKNSLKRHSASGNLGLSGKSIEIPAEESLPGLKRGRTVMEDGHYTIELFKHGDISTLAHEFSHVFLLQMLDLASKDAATDSMLEDLKKIRLWGMKELSAQVRKLWAAQGNNIDDSQNSDFMKVYKSFADSRGLDVTNGRTARMFVEAHSKLASLKKEERLFAEDKVIADFFRIQLHESFARGFEQYLMQGEAPTDGLRKVFRQFASWLTKIYKNFLNLNIEISEEIRNVFDRMLATEAEVIAEYNRRNAIINSKMKMKKSRLQESEQQALARAGSEAAEKRAVFRIERRKKLGFQTDREIRRRKEYASAMAIRDQGGLDYVVAKEEFSKDIFESLQAMDCIALSDRRGITDFEAVAEKFRFSDSLKMIQAIVNAPDLNEEIEKAIAGKIDREIRNQSFGIADALDDQMDDVFAERQKVLLGLKSEAQTKQSGRGVKPELGAVSEFTPAQVIEFARTEVERQTGSLSTKYYQSERYRKESARWNERVRTALQRGDTRTASDANFFARLATAKIKVCEEMQKKIDEKLKDAEGVINRTYKAIGEKSARIDYAYAAALLRLAGRLDMTNPKALRFIQGSLISNQENTNFKTIHTLLDTYYEEMYELSEEDKKGIEDFISVMSKDPASTYWSAALLDETKQRPWKQLAYPEFIEAVSLLEFLEQRMTMKAGMLYSGENVEDVVNSIEKNAKTLSRSKRVKQNETVFGLKRLANQFLAEHDSLSMLLKSILGYTEAAENDPYYMALAKAATEKIRLQQKAQKLLNPAFEQIAKSGFKFSDDIPSTVKVPEILSHLGGGWTWDRRIAIAMMMGTSESVQRLKNYGLNMGDCLELTSILTETDWMAIQSVWKTFDSVSKPAMKSTYEKMFRGVIFDEAQARPFDVITSEGKTLHLQGGYFPIRYDKQLQSISENGVEESVIPGTEPFSPNGQHFQNVQTGSIFSRVKTISNPHLFPVLSTSLIFRVLDEQLTWATHAEIISDLNRIIRHSTFRRAFIGHLGIEKYKKMMPGLNFIAVGESYYHEALHAPFNFIRNRAQKVFLGANPRTAFIQFTAIPGMVTTIGYRNLLNGFKHLMKNGPVETIRFICESSPDMNARWFNTDYASNHTKVIQNRGGIAERSAFGKKFKYYAGKTEKKITNSLFWPVLNLTDMMMTAPGWMGCYLSGLEQFNGDESRAKAYANEKVAEAQPVGRTMDKSYAEYSNGIYRLFNMFSSYTVRSGGVFSSRGRYLYRAMKSGKLSGKEYAKYVMNEGVLVPLMTRAMLMLLWWRWPEEEDVQDLAWEIFSVNASGLIGVRDAANTIQRKFGGSYSANFGSLQTEVVDEFLSDLIYIGKYAGTDDVRNEKAILRGANLFSWVFGIPAKRLYSNAVKGWKEMSEEESSLMSFFIADPKYRNPTRSKKKE